MTSPRRFEHDLPVLLADMYLARTPDYRDDLVQRIARVRQRPAWTFPERWLPMDLATKALPGATRIPWRIVGVLALLAALLAGMLAFYAGSQRRLPEPFGPAANGALVFAADGDILSADPVTGRTATLVSSPEIDSVPIWSRDGTRFVFRRQLKSTGDPGVLIVARADGSGLVQITPEPLNGLSDWSFSPDGRSVSAIALEDRRSVILVASSDGTQPARTFAVDVSPDDGGPEYRPDGAEILAVGKPSGAAARGVYALDPVTGAVRTVIAARPDADIWGATWSPDGTKIAYGIIDPSATTMSARTHVVGVDGTGDVAVDTDPDSIADAGLAWSNDGTRLVVTRYYETNTTRSAIVPIDRSSTGIEIACPTGAAPDDCGADWSWSPDDTVLRGTRDEDGPSGQQTLADPLTGEIRTAPSTTADQADWQRLAN